MIYSLPVTSTRLAEEPHLAAAGRLRRYLGVCDEVVGSAVPGDGAEELFQVVGIGCGRVEPEGFGFGALEDDRHTLPIRIPVERSHEVVGLCSDDGAG
jgi:hypothetical protein